MSGFSSCRPVMWMLIALSTCVPLKAQERLANITSCNDDGGKSTMVLSAYVEGSAPMAPPVCSGSSRGGAKAAAPEKIGADSGATTTPSGNTTEASLPTSSENPTDFAVGVGAAKTGNAPLEVYNLGDYQGGDSIWLYNTEAATRRTAIMFSTVCAPPPPVTNLSECSNSGSLQEEFEMGVDQAPNGSHNFFLFDELLNQGVLWVSSADQVDFGTTFIPTPSASAQPGELTVPRYNVHGTRPTCWAGGIGSSGSCEPQAGSTDSAGRLILTVGGSNPAATGTVTLMFATSFGSTSPPFCIAQASNENATWSSSGAAQTWFSLLNTSNTSVQWQWTNNQVLAAGNSYNVVYICVGN